MSSPRTQPAPPAPPISRSPPENRPRLADPARLGTCRTQKTAPNRAKPRRLLRSAVLAGKKCEKQDKTGQNRTFQDISGHFRTCDRFAAPDQRRCPQKTRKTRQNRTFQDI